MGWDGDLDLRLARSDCWTIISMLFGMHLTFRVRQSWKEGNGILTYSERVHKQEKNVENRCINSKK